MITEVAESSKMLANAFQTVWKCILDSSNFLYYLDRRW